MPGMCLPVKEGGIGFDYRLSMGLPDYFIKTIREKQDGQWNMGRLYYELISRRPGEKNIAYCESHDQALVGDKTLMFRLADKEMYWGMNRGYENMVVERAVALHKMIRLVTIAAGGEGYLNFMGNEFGHPEWIDFPREGNDWSFAHARRLWRKKAASSCSTSIQRAHRRGCSCPCRRTATIRSCFPRTTRYLAVIRTSTRP